MRGIRNIIRQLQMRRKKNFLFFLKGIFLAIGWQIYKRKFGVPIIIETYKQTRFILRPDCIISSRFIYEGYPDIRNIWVLSHFAGEDTNTILIDIGCNVGLYSVLLCRDYHRGILFEPNPVAAQMARENLCVNGLSERFQVMEIAAGENNGFAYFPMLDVPLPTANIDSIASADKIQVQVARLDELLSPPGEIAVKIDAEGSDGEVVRGLSKFFETGKIKICQFECPSNRMLRSIQEFFVNKEFGYVLMDWDKEAKSMAANQVSNFYLVRQDLLGFYSNLINSYNEKKVLRSA